MNTIEEFYLRWIKEQERKFEMEKNCVRNGYGMK